MRIEDWMDERGFKMRDLMAMLAEDYVESPSRQTLYNIITGKKQAGLELAIIINEVTKGAVEYRDMLVSSKCRYTTEQEAPTNGLVIELPNQEELSEVDDLLNSL